MAKLTLSDVSNINGNPTSAATTLNANAALIETAVENTLSRDGTGPNAMQDDLDMNSNRILNLPDAVNSAEPVTLGQAATIAGVTNPLTQDDIGSYLWPQTAEELAAAVTPTYFYYPPGDVRRYGAVGDGGTDDSAAIQAALDSGHAVTFQPATTYYFATGLTWDQDYGVIYGNGCTFLTDQDIIGLTIGQLGAANFVFSCSILGWPLFKNTNVASTKQGILLKQVYESKFQVSTQGWHTGVELTSDDEGCVYNDFYFGRVYDHNTYGVYLHPTSNGWVNENNFHGGRFGLASGNTASWHIYMPDSGSTYGNPNNNKWFGPSLEMPATSTMEGLYLDGGVQNLLFHPRLESSGTINQTNIVITEDATGATILYPYATYYDSDVTDDGSQTTYINRDKLLVVSRQASPADTLLSIWREDGNNNGTPSAEIVDAYNESQASMGLLLRLARSNITNDYSIKGEDMGTIRLGADGRNYECILSHTSDAADEPGVGVNWATYWRLLPTRTATNVSWATATSYTGYTTRWQIRALGNAEFRTAKLQSAAVAGDTGEVVLGNTTQATVGAAGAATALPANPTGYLKFYIGATQYVIPYYLQA